MGSGAIHGVTCLAAGCHLDFQACGEMLSRRHTLLTARALTTDPQLSTRSGNELLRTRGRDGPNAGHFVGRQTEAGHICGLLTPFLYDRCQDMVTISKIINSKGKERSKIMIGRKNSMGK